MHPEVFNLFRVGLRLAVPGVFISRSAGQVNVLLIRRDLPDLLDDLFRCPRLGMADGFSDPFPVQTSHAAQFVHLKAKEVLAQDLPVMMQKIQIIIVLFVKGSALQTVHIERITLPAHEFIKLPVPLGDAIELHLLRDAAVHCDSEPCKITDHSVPDQCFHIVRAVCNQNFHLSPQFNTKEQQSLIPSRNRS